MRFCRSFQMKVSVPTGTPMMTIPSVTILMPCVSAFSCRRCVTTPLLTRSLHLGRHSSIPVRSLMVSAYPTMLSSSCSPSPYRLQSSAKPPALAVSLSG